ncbi:MAG TPA: hypothetical protein VIU46_09335 [Gallionellaceae bacterium]
MYNLLSSRRCEDHIRNCILGTRAPEAQRFVLWFEREVLKPIKYRAANRMPIPEEVD